MRCINWVLGLCIVLLASTSWAGGTITGPSTEFQPDYTCQVVTADALIKTGAGTLHTVTFSQADAAPTAGTIILYDNTAESGTKILDWSGITIAVFNIINVTLDDAFKTGLYVGFTTTTDVNVTVCYR